MDLVPPHRMVVEDLADRPLELFREAAVHGGRAVRRACLLGSGRSQLVRIAEVLRFPATSARAMTYLNLRAN